MPEKKILEVCQQHFPNAEIVIFTGSQVTKAQLDKNSDIDIVIIDKLFSVVSSRAIVLNELKFDFTLVPFYDLDSVLNNERFDYKGTLLTMIQNGKILLQKQELGDILKEKVSKIYTQKNPVFSAKFNNVLSELHKFKKVFGTELNFRERFISVNSFINLITEAEIAKNSNWHFSNKQKARILEKENPLFVEEIINLTKGLMLGEKDTDPTSLLHYIEYYSSSATLPENTDETSKYVIDIGSPELSIKMLALIIQMIKEDSILKDYFLYFFSSPTKLHRIFKHKFSIVFSLDDAIDKKQIYLKMFKILQQQDCKNINISVDANLIFSNLNSTVNIWGEFEAIAKKFNRLVVNEVNNTNNFDVEKNVFLMIIFLGFISRELDLSIDELLYANQYLLKRWCFSKEDQYNSNSQDNLSIVGARKLSVYAEYYKKNHLDIVSCLKKGISFNLKEDTGKSYYTVLIEIKKFIASQKDLTGEYIENNLFSNIQFNEIHSDNNGKLLIYITLFEQIVHFLHFENIQIGLSLYLTIESIKFLRLEKNRMAI